MKDVPAMSLHKWSSIWATYHDNDRPTASYLFAFSLGRTSLDNSRVDKRKQIMTLDQNSYQMRRWLILPPAKSPGVIRRDFKKHLGK
jgi:hypothetical protein